MLITEWWNSTVQIKNWFHQPALQRCILAWLVAKLYEPIPRRGSPSLGTMNDNRDQFRCSCTQRSCSVPSISLHQWNNESRYNKCLHWWWIKQLKISNSNQSNWEMERTVNNIHIVLIGDNLHSYLWLLQYWFMIVSQISFLRTLFSIFNSSRFGSLVKHFAATFGSKSWNEIGRSPNIGCGILPKKSYMHVYGGTLI